jgi:dihydroxy-acid dehydratase
MPKNQDNRGHLRSSIMTKGLDRAIHRSLFYSTGWRPTHLEKPLVAVMNSFNDSNRLTQASQRGL